MSSEIQNTSETNANINENIDKTIENNNENNEEINSETNETNNSINNEMNTEDNEEENESNVDSDDDIMGVLYGEHENDENDENDESDEEIDYYNNYEEEETINHINSSEDSKVHVLTIIENDGQQKQSNNNSNKRQSSDDNSSQAKRVKSEPMSPKRVSNNDNNNDTESESLGEKRITTTFEKIVCNEIPKSSQDFMKHILEWDANSLDSGNENQIPMYENLKDITNLLSFNEFDVFRDTFIPPIIVNLWERLKREYSLKHKNISKVNETIRFHSIINKNKSKKMKEGLEMKCISMRKVNDSSVFKFGQLVLIRTAVQLKPNSNAHSITRKSYFGYVYSHTIREYNQQNQTEVNHMKLFNEDKRDSIFVEEVIFLTKFSDELFLRNDTLIVAEPVLCIHNYYLEARAVFKFQEFPLWRQIFNPIFSSKASGVLVDNVDNDLNDNHLECIQVALDVIATHSFANSFFMAINHSQSSSRTRLLIQIIKQVLLCDQFKQSKVLFTSSDNICLNNVNENLKRLRIIPFVVDNDLSPTFIKSVIKHIQHKLTKDIIVKDMKKKQLYEESLKYFESNMDFELSVESTLFKNNICEQVRHDLMNISPVIIGRIDDMCNDIAFYKHFSSRDAFNCCIIDDSNDINEPNLYSLFWFGIKKFILAGNLSYDNNSEDSNVCKRLGLSRSFFKRYYSLRPLNLVNTTVTLFDF